MRLLYLVLIEFIAGPIDSPLNINNEIGEKVALKYNKTKKTNYSSYVISKPFNKIISSFFTGKDNPQRRNRGLRPSLFLS